MAVVIFATLSIWPHIEPEPSKINRISVELACAAALMQLIAVAVINAFFVALKVLAILIPISKFFSNRKTYFTA
ncbi:hypothetical protein GCM10009077_42910 [Roseibium denhamense]